jgi:GT2 family glycosyltransferase
VLSAIRREQRIRRLHSLGPDEEYQLWLARNAMALRNESATIPQPTSFLVYVIRSGRSDTDLQVTKSSLAGAAIATRYSLLTADDFAALPVELESPFITAVSAGDRFAAYALDTIALALEHADPRTVLYADEDVLRSDGSRSRPFFKPSWSPYYSLTFPGIFPGSPFIIPKDIWKELWTDASLAPTDWLECMFLAAEKACRVVHLPQPLLSRPERGGANDSLLGSCSRRLTIAQRAAKRRRIEATPVLGDAPDTARMDLSSMPVQPRVSVIIPTRDHPEFLIPLDAALQSEAGPSPLEILYLDHETKDSQALEHLRMCEQRQGTRVIRITGEFNFSHMINEGARAATGDILILLNNDILPLHPRWIDELARAAMLPGVAAAGPLLLYPDSTVQHAGIVLGVGVIAGHLGKGEPVDLPTFPPRVLREVSAVTGACLAVRRKAYEEVGGLDETALRVSFSDVELCLKLRQRSWSVVLQPEVRLVHFETSSRDPEVDPNETRVMLERWREELLSDPYWHPAFTRITEKVHLDLWKSCCGKPRVIENRMGSTLRKSDHSTRNRGLDDISG